MKKTKKTADSLVVRFAENLRAERARRNLSQAELADKVGISVSYVSMLERGQRSPPLDMVERIATALRMKPVELFA